MSTTGLGHDSSTRRGSNSKKSTSHYDAQRYERREKAKSNQEYNNYAYTQHAAHAVPVVTPPANAHTGQQQQQRQRPQLQPRTTSAPLLSHKTAAGAAARPTPSDRGPETLSVPFPHSPTRALVEGQDEDEAHGVVGALRTFHPFHSPEVRVVLL